MFRSQNHSLVSRVELELVAQSGVTSSDLSVLPNRLSERGDWHYSRPPVQNIRVSVQANFWQPQQPQQAFIEQFPERWELPPLSPISAAPAESVFQEDDSQVQELISTAQQLHDPQREEEIRREQQRAEELRQRLQLRKKLQHAAASKRCREKKKENEKKMQEENSQLRAENIHLRVENEGLRAKYESVEQLLKPSSELNWDTKSAGTLFAARNRKRSFSHDINESSVRSSSQRFSMSKHPAN